MAQQQLEMKDSPTVYMEVKSFGLFLTKYFLIKQVVLYFMFQEEKMPQRLTEISGNKYKGIYV